MQEEIEEIKGMDPKKTYLVVVKSTTSTRVMEKIGDQIRSAGINNIIVRKGLIEFIEPKEEE